MSPTTRKGTSFSASRANQVVVLSSIDDLAMRTRSPTLISLNDHLYIPPEKISNLAVDKNFTEHAVDVALFLVNAFPEVDVQNLSYSTRELRPVGAFNQLAHLRVRVPELIVIGFHLPSEFTLYYKRKGESYTNTILRFDTGNEHQHRGERGSLHDHLM